MAIVVNWISGFAFGLIFPLMSSGLGSYVFLPFAGVLTVSFLTILALVPETKGKTLSMILHEMGVR